MKYPYAVKCNGEYYPSGAEVTEGLSSEVNSKESVEKKEPKQYSRTIINRMSTAELQQTALEEGIEDAGERTGAELKKILVERLGL